MSVFQAAPGHPAQQQVLILAAIAQTNITVNTQNADLKEPVLTLQNGSKIEGGGAIVRHISRWAQSSQLLPNNNLQAANCEQWLDVAKQIERASFAWVAPFCNDSANSDHQRALAKTFIERALNALETHLQHHACLVTDGTTAADVAMVCTLMPLFATVLSQQARQAFPNVARYLTACAALPPFAKVLGKASFCTEADGWHCAAADAQKSDKKAAKGGAAGGKLADGANGTDKEEVDPVKAAKKVR